MGYVGHFEIFCAFIINGTKKSTLAEHCSLLRYRVKAKFLIILKCSYMYVTDKPNMPHLVISHLNLHCLPLSLFVGIQ